MYCTINLRGRKNTYDAYHTESIPSKRHPTIITFPNRCCPRRVSTRLRSNRKSLLVRCFTVLFDPSQSLLQFSMPSSPSRIPPGECYNSLPSPHPNEQRIRRSTVPSLPTLSFFMLQFPAKLPQKQPKKNNLGKRLCIRPGLFRIGYAPLPELKR